MGFKGFVMSDWMAAHSSGALMNGLDQEMPFGKLFNNTILKAMLANGTATLAKVDDSVVRILSPLLAVGALDRPAEILIRTQYYNTTSAAHDRLARTLAAKTILLLQNEDRPLEPAAPTLPLELSAIKNFALFGDQASLHVTVGGGGSGAVSPRYTSTPLGALRGRLGFPPQHNETSACHSGQCIRYYESAVAVEAAAVAAAVELADVALVFAATSSTEGRDRYDLSLNGKYCEGGAEHYCPKGQDALVSAVTAPPRLRTNRAWWW